MVGRSGGWVERSGGRVERSGGRGSSELRGEKTIVGVKSADGRRVRPAARRGRLEFKRRGRSGRGSGVAFALHTLEADLREVDPEFQFSFYEVRSEWVSQDNGVTGNGLWFSLGPGCKKILFFWR